MQQECELDGDCLQGNVGKHHWQVALHFSHSWLPTCNEDQPKENSYGDLKCTEDTLQYAKDL